MTNKPVLIASGGMERTTLEEILKKQGLTEDEVIIVNLDDIKDKETLKKILVIDTYPGESGLKEVKEEVFKINAPQHLEELPPFIMQTQPYVEKPFYQKHGHSVPSTFANPNYKPKNENNGLSYMGL